MRALMGFILGVIAVKAGPQTYAKVRGVWAEISESVEFRELMAALSASVESTLAGGSDAVAERLKALVSENGDLGEALQSVTGQADLRGVWAAIANSTEVSGLLATGLSVVGGALEKFASGGTPPETETPADADL